MSISSRRNTLQVFVNYPETEVGKLKFLNNLAIFKAELLLKSIENINVKDEIKDEVLEKVLELLDDKPKDSVI